MVNRDDPEEFKNSVKEFDSLGKYLKYIRESNGITIDNVVVDTRIRKVYIEALEEEDYSILPERTYALGYLRVYANYLNINNVEELVDYLDESYNFYTPVYGDNKNVQDNNVLMKKKSFKDVSSKEDDNQDDFKKNLNRNLTIKDDSKKVSLEDASDNVKNKKIVIILSVAVVIVGVFVGVLVSIIAGNYNKSHSLKKQDVQDTKDIEEVSNVVKNQDFVVVHQQETVAKLNNDVGASDNSANSNNNSNTSTSDNSIDNRYNENLQVPNSVITSGENKAEVNTESIVPFPKETKARDISIVFFEDVWIKVYNSKDSNEIYLNKIFKAGSTYNVPGVENLSLDIGNYKGLYFVLDGSTRVYLTRTGSRLVMKNILLDKQDLLKKYS